MITEPYKYAGQFTIPESDLKPEYMQYKVVIKPYKTIFGKTKWQATVIAEYYNDVQKKFLPLEYMYEAKLYGKTYDEASTKATEWVNAIKEAHKANKDRKTAIEEATATYYL